MLSCAQDGMLATFFTTLAADLWAVAECQNTAASKDELG